MMLPQLLPSLVPLRIHYIRSLSVLVHWMTEKRVAAVLKQNPDAQPGRTKVLELLNQNGHDAVYTPPFTPDFQPIELLWANIKHNVSSRPVLNRSLDETRDMAERAFEAVTPQQCKNMIRHAQKCMDEFIKSDAGGVLQQCGSLSALLSLSEEELSMLEMPDASVI